MMEKNSKIYVAGHRGMVGSAIVRELQRQGYYKYPYTDASRIGFDPPRQGGTILCRGKAGVCIPCGC